MRNENERRATQPTFAAADRNVAIAAETFALKPRRVRSRLTWENEIVRLAIPDVGLLILIRIGLCIAYLEFHRAELGRHESALDGSIKGEIQRIGHRAIDAKPALQVAAVVVKLQLQETYDIATPRDAHARRRSQRC